jgi:hypothetical protein
VNAPKEFALARLCAKAHKLRAQERAVEFAAKARCPVYAYPTRNGFGFDTVPPLGWCIIAQPSGVVTERAAPIV